MVDSDEEMPSSRIHTNEIENMCGIKVISGAGGSKTVRESGKDDNKFESKVSN